MKSAYDVIEGLASGYANSIKPKATSFNIDVIDTRSVAVNFNGLFVLSSKIYKNINYYKNI